MKREFYKTMYRLLAGATRRVNWRWLNEWKVAMGISLIAAGCVGAGKEAATAGMGADVKAPEAIHADTLRLPDERAKEEDALLISDPEVDAKPLFLGNWRVYFQGHLSYPPEALEEGATGRVYVQFTIGTDGSIGNARVAQSVCPVLDSAAVAFVSKLPPFLPAKREGQAVEVEYMLPVDYTPAMREKARERLGVLCYDAIDLDDPLDDLKVHILEHVQYPEEARKRKIAGTVYVEVHVGTDGSVGNARIVRGVHPLLDKEVLRAIREMPPWASGRRIYYKPVEENYVIGIPFV